MSFILNLGSTGDVKYEHLRMNGDRIIVVIPRHKGDRSGEKPTEKSPYSNPTSPQICPFLALGIVLLSREIYKDCDSIILGKKTDENINIWLRSVSAAAVVGASGAYQRTSLSNQEVIRRLEDQSADYHLGI